MSAIIRRRRITAASPTPEKLATFLRHLEESGSVSFAAERTGIGRNTVYRVRKVDPAFARGWEKAVAMAVETLRDIAIARARDDTERVVAARPVANKSEQLEHEQNRRRVGVLFDMPERPGLSAFLQRSFLKKCDSA